MELVEIKPDAPSWRAFVRDEPFNDEMRDFFAKADDVQIDGNDAAELPDLLFATRVRLNNMPNLERLPAMPMVKDLLLNTMAKLLPLARLPETVERVRFWHLPLWDRLPEGTERFLPTVDPNADEAERKRVQQLRNNAVFDLPVEGIEQTAPMVVNAPPEYRPRAAMID